MRKDNKGFLQVALLLFLIIGCPANGFSDSSPTSPEISETIITPAPEEKPATLWPNRGSKTLTIPSGWGASWGVLFVGGGITTPAAYSSSSDGAISFGMGLGNPFSHIGAQLSSTVWDVSKFDNFAFGFKLHRYIGYGSSIAVGGENLFADKSKTDTNESYYLVVSHAFRQVPSKTPGVSALHATFGVGTERFGKKSPLDIKKGKGKHGTYVFGSLAYEVLYSTNIIVEWNGLNLTAGVSLAPLKKIPIGITLGVADLTSYSGDGPRFIASAGYAFQF